MGFGFFAGGFGPGRHWMWGERGHRRFKRGLLKWIVLKLIAEGERHGYDILRVFEERGWGGARAGSVYPILSMLEEAGLVTTREENGKRVYVITEKGLHHLREEGPDINLDDLSSEDEERYPVRDALRKLVAAVMQARPAANEQTVAQIVEILNRARKEIYTLLANE
jgi:DNA-binding PadR family transcriptional regulator